MLGSQFLKTLSGSSDFEMYAFSKEDLDITDKSNLEDIFEKIFPNIVINCSAYTAVDDCEHNKELAFKINGDAVKEIATMCHKKNACLIHFSTDYVFDGSKDEGYKEDDIPSPINIYGESKLKGEKFITENMSNYYIIRTSWLFGENGKNFVDTMINLANKKNDLKVIDDQIGAPTYTKDLSEAVFKFFLTPFLSNLPHQHAHDLGEDDDSKNNFLPFGIYHLTNSGSTNWFDFANEIFKIMKLEVNIKPVASNNFLRPAKRPKCSILLNTKIKDNLRPWNDALKAYLKLNY